MKIKFIHKLFDIEHNATQYSRFAIQVGNYVAIENKEYKIYKVLSEFDKIQDCLELDSIIVYIEDDVKIHIDIDDFAGATTLHTKPACDNCKFLDTSVMLTSYPGQYRCKCLESKVGSVVCDKTSSTVCEFHQFISAKQNHFTFPDAFYVPTQGNGI